MKLLLPGGGGAGGIINWGGRVQKKIFLPGGRGAGGIFSWGGRVQNHFSDLKFFFEIQLKNTLNLIFPSFKMSSERFLFKDFKTRLTFWHMWFFNFQNLVRSCQPLGGTPCTIQCMGQGISFKSERNNSWFKLWFNILLHTKSIACATVFGQCLGYLGYIILGAGKVIYTKYSKHWPYTVAHTIDCVCRKC